MAQDVVGRKWLRSEDILAESVPRQVGDNSRSHTALGTVGLEGVSDVHPSPAPTVPFGVCRYERVSSVLTRELPFVNQA